jgi:hypothetical protein
MIESPREYVSRVCNGCGPILLLSLAKECRENDMTRTHTVAVLVGGLRKGSFTRRLAEAMIKIPASRWWGDRTAPALQSGS